MLKTTSEGTFSSPQYVFLCLDPINKVRNIIKRCFSVNIFSSFFPVVYYFEFLGFHYNICSGIKSSVCSRKTNYMVTRFAVAFDTTKHLSCRWQGEHSTTSGPVAGVAQ